MRMTKPPTPKQEERVPDTGHRTQLRLLVALLTLASLWVARSFLLELAWAVTLAVALWPLYRRALARRAKPGPSILVPLGFTIATGLVVMMPIALVAVEAARDSDAAVQWLNHAQSAGIAAPAWLDRVPMVGSRLALWWQANLATPAGASAFIGGLDTSETAGWVRV